MQEKPVALITGASQGIGLQVAKDLAAQGFTVLVGSRDWERGVVAAREVGAEAHAIQLDVTVPDSIAAAAQRVADEFGRLDVLINNAAIAHSGRRSSVTVAEYPKLFSASVVPLDEVREVFETNVFGPLAVYQALLPLLRTTPGARVVNVSSGAGSLTLHSDPSFPYRPGFTPLYHASKTALNAMTVAMAVEAEPSGIKVNAVSPGSTKTKLNNYEGEASVEEGAREVVRVALLGPDSPTGSFTHVQLGKLPW